MTTVGLCVPQLRGLVTRDSFRDFVQSADELGYRGLWVQEHLFYPHAPVPGYGMVPEAYRSVLSALETLSMAAAWSTHAEIGTSVLIGGYHRPLQLAQQLATLDVLSGGRLVAGFASGWRDDEHVQAGVDPRTRGRRLDQMLDAMEACWGPDPVRFESEFFSIPAADVRPKPLQTPRPRLLSGMNSPAGLRRTAERFDIWNPASGTFQEVVETVGRLQEQRPAGKDPLEIYWRIFVEVPRPVPGVSLRSVEQLADDVRRAREAGFAHVMVDANYDPSIGSPEDWATLPERLSPLLDAAR